MKTTVTAPKFGNSIAIVDAPTMAINVSEDKQAVTLILANVGATVGGPLDANLSNTRSFAFSFGQLSPDADASLTIDVRGAYRADKKARLVLVVQAAGKTKVINLKKAAVGSGKSDGWRDFEHRITTTIKAGVACPVTLIAHAERDVMGDDVGAVLQVDSVDFAIVAKAAKAK